MFPGKKILTVTMALALVMAILVAGLEAAKTAQAAPPIQEAAPQRATIPYVGQLNNAAGKPVADGVYDFTFSLYDAPERGNLLWTGTQAGVTVRGGSFLASLGSGAGLPKAVLDRKESWLTVSVRGPGEIGFTALAPRQLLPTAGPAAVSALSCPHSHFGDSWPGNQPAGPSILNMGTGDGLDVRTNGVPACSALPRWVLALSSRTRMTASKQQQIATKAPFTPTSPNGNGVWAVAGGGGIGVYGKGADGVGGYFESAQFDGLRATTLNPTDYWGAVILDGGLAVSGGCSGCSIAYRGLNGGSATLQRGDLVAAAGVEVDEVTGEPILLVRLASQPDDAVIGVALGAAASPSETQRTGKKAPAKKDTSVIAGGEYLNVMVSGLTQVRVGSTKIAVGEHLAPGRDGAIAATDATGSVARVLSVPDANGLAWAMVNAR